MKVRVKKVEIIHSSRNHCWPLKTINHSGPAQIKITQTGQAKLRPPFTYPCDLPLGSVSTTFGPTSLGGDSE